MNDYFTAFLLSIVFVAAFWLGVNWQIRRGNE